MALLYFRSEGVLYHFVTDFVEKTFINQKLFEVSEKANTATKGNRYLEMKRCYCE